MRSRRSAVAIGNALQNLQAFVQPQVRYVLQEQLQEEANEEDDETKDPREHLLRQARRLQRGEDIEQLTALWSPQTTDLE